MANPLQTYVGPNKIREVYWKIKQQLGCDDIVFLAMEHVSQRKGIPFQPPTTVSEYSLKHQEVEQHLTRMSNVRNQRNLVFQLIEEIHSKLIIGGQEIHAERLRDLAVIETDKEFKIKLTADTAWLMEWDVDIEYEGYNDKREVAVISYEREWKNIVPWAVVQYLRSAILLYQQNAYITSLALMSIAVEATLRDILSTKGYTFNAGASKVDVYDYAKIHVNLSAIGYQLVFTDPMPASPADLPTSAGGTLPVEIRIRRVAKKDNKFDLLIKDPPAYLLDHFSCNRIVESGQPKSIGGLGEALGIARNVERIITPLDLPTDVDEVLKAVRNNLIHLSSESMHTELPQYAYMSSSGQFTIADFVAKQELVFDLVTDIPRFVNEQYVKLWKAGIHIPDGDHS
jgi:hypothetical protein